MPGKSPTIPGSRIKKHGKKKWRKHVADVVEKFIAALEPDDVVLGGGNIHNLKVLPPGCRVGDNANAFLRGFRLWNEANGRRGCARTPAHLRKRKGKQA